MAREPRLPRRPRRPRRPGKKLGRLGRDGLGLREGRNLGRGEKRGALLRVLFPGHVFSFPAVAPSERRRGRQGCRGRQVNLVGALAVLAKTGAGISYTARNGSVRRRFGRRLALPPRGVTIIDGLDPARPRLVTSRRMLQERRLWQAAFSQTAAAISTTIFGRFARRLRPWDGRELESSIAVEAVRRFTLATRQWHPALTKDVPLG